MAGLFDIGSSGIQAYRKALSVTGQNIANLNTEGYRRREASMEEVSATQGGILSISDQAGLGVRVSDVSRAFDSFIASRARDTSSDYERAESYKEALTTLESILLPEDYDLTFSINEFFNGISSIAQAPGDLSGRVVALEQGRSLASAFQSLSGSLQTFQSAITSEVDNMVGSLNTELAGLADIQARLISAGGSGKASNALMDQRDKSIAAIADYAGVSARYNVRGDTTLTLGATGSGPVLLEGKTASQISVIAQDSQIDVYIGAGGGALQTQQMTSGGLAGLIAAYETVSQTSRELDALARKVASELNSVHSEGVSLDGKTGGALFGLDSFMLEPSATNLGSVTGYVSSVGPLPEEDVELEIVYNSANSMWQGRDEAGDVVAQGQNGFVFAGLNVSLVGQPADGDTFALELSRGKAANMQFLLTRPQEFAAAGPLLTTSDVSNTGSANLAFEAFSAQAPSDLPMLTQLLANDIGIAAATRFRSDGVIGVIPADVSEVDLFSLTRQDLASFTLADAQFANLSSITLTLDEVSHQFDTAAFAERRSTESNVNLSELADMLNAGILQSSSGASFADLGLFASGEAGVLSIASGIAGLSAAVLQADETVTGSISQKNDIGSQIQVFTREGRQIAGTPLSDSEVMRYLTPANGFLETVEYRAEHLNGVGSGGFQSTEVSRATPGGAYGLKVSGEGFAPPVWAGSSLPVSVATPAQTLSIAVGSDPETKLEIPQGVMADYIAEQVNTLSSDLGIRAKAETRVLLQAIPEGIVSFGLTGENKDPVAIQGYARAGDLSDMVELINAQTSNTGISAHLSSDLGQLVLVNEAGSDILLSDIVVEGEGFEAFAVGAQGQLRSDSPVLLGTAANQFARFGGEVSLSAARSFTVSGAGGTKTSTADPLHQGFISRAADPAGSWQQLSFRAIEGIDGNEARPDGSFASAAAASFSVSLETDGSSARLSASVLSSDLDELSSQAIAQALATDLRSLAPVPVLSGRSFSDVDGLPSDGETITLELGEQSFVLRMVDGEVVVEGPEAERLTAGFDDSFKLVVSASQGFETGQTLRVSSDASTASMTAFGLEVDQQLEVLTGRSFLQNTLSSQPHVLSLEIDDTQYDISLTLDENDVVQIAQNPDLPLGTTLSVNSVSDTEVQITIRRTEAGTAGALRILPSEGGRALGFVTSPNQILVNQDGLRLSALDQSAIDVQATSGGLISERISLKNLPPEELIVILTGDGARRLSAQFERDTSDIEVGLQRPLDIVVEDGASGRIEILDRESGHSIASRYLDETGRFSVAGVDLVISGAVKTGDRFSIAPNTAGEGDGRNVAKLLGLQTTDLQSGKGGFSQSFSVLITDAGAKVQASTIAAASSLAVRDAAAEMESEFSGVNLDTEAARLLEQQQAYQALARVLSTAKELLDTLMNAI
ncbi:flagellar hook-associated protein FlgK [uncultured Lentibacter sp.]|uniref:flagellar hook-associated protein FlgK n=1 Tax=uncultured Lentibacter sp. TaxID=1659309 RepID=UPI0026115699|nr:flagellar hook-associated protein FlgK [uncultured Lentibacter sp.]